MKLLLTAVLPQALDDRICSIVKEIFKTVDWPVDSMEAQNAIQLLTELVRPWNPEAIANRARLDEHRILCPICAGGIDFMKCERGRLLKGELEQ